MPVTVRSVICRVAAGVCIVVALAAPAAAQQEALAEAPEHVEFMSRYDYHLSGAFLGSDDHARFMWDTHWGGDFDLVDYVKGRVSFLIDYQAILGDEYRPFDPNQGNYTLEFSGSGRLGKTEFVGAFHHVSRHLSDRPKRQAIAMNVLEGRILRHFDLRDTTIDLRANVGRLIQHSYVDYTWIGDVNVIVRHNLKPRVGTYGRIFGELYGVNDDDEPFLVKRGAQRGGRVEAGVRLSGKGGAMELFAGYERVIDADPFDRQARQWPFAGFRLVN
jgi:hypothetical protein